MEHQFEDRLALAPYVGSNIKLIGVVIRINSILYDRYKDHKQVVVASVYDIEHDIQLDHINLKQISFTCMNQLVSAVRSLNI